MNIKLTYIFLVAFTFLVNSSVNAQYLFKLSPTAVVLSGEVGLSYEQALRPKMSLEVQVGTTFSKKIIPVELFKSTEYTGDAVMKNDWGYFGALSLRYYFYKYQMAPAGFYVGTLYKYRLYNVKYEDQQYGLEAKRGTNSQFLLQAVAGYQLPVTDYLSFDFYIGLGANIQTIKSYNNTYSVDAVTAETTYFWQENKKKPTTFAPTVGVKIGFGKSGKDWLN
jgi:hypothetical protein